MIAGGDAAAKAAPAARARERAARLAVAKR
jgi:hypothetical protein